MAEKLGHRLHLGQAVRSIRQDGKRYVIETGDRVYGAQHVVVAMMPSDLMRIRFEPELPQLKLEQASRWANMI